MEWMDLLIKIGGAITAIGVIWAAITTAVKRTINKVLSPVVEDIKEVKEHCYENYLSELRLTIMSSDMPLGERIVAADKYIKRGGNGEVKKYAIEELHINDIHHND